MSNRRQILHLALGSEACELTTHLVNLQGLAATSSHDDEPAYCDLDLSHSIYNQLHVPRVLYIDEGRNMTRNKRNTVPEELASECWKGAVETLAKEHLPPADTSTAPDAFDAFFDSASIMTTNQHSRYRSQNKFQSTSRHVNWDEEEDMVDDDDQERMHRAKQAWQQQTQPELQRELEDFWSNSMETAVPTPWCHYLAPPYHPKSLLSLPTTSFEEEFGYYNYTHSLHWLEDDCFERLRWLLEECDSCQGVVLASSRAWGSGLATKLLQELEQEVPSASRWMISMTQNDESAASANGDDIDPPTWRTQQVQNVRRRLQTGLALAEHSQHAHAVLPLSGDIRPVQAAAALETATLSYRLSPAASKSAKIGLNSYYGGSYGGEFPFGTVTCLSFAEFLTSLKPSNAHLMLELDTLLPTTEYSFDSIRQGTSLERDMRMKQLRETSSKRPKDELPGLWLMDTAANGLMSPCSPYPTNRSLHDHFCLASAMRPAASQSTVSEQTLCLMESVGIRFQPEQSSATVLAHSLPRLVEGGYAAGAYWKSRYNLKPTTTTLAVLGNTTRSFGLLERTCIDMKTIFGPSMKGFYSRDVRSGILPELEDVENALSLVYNLRDTYRPPEGSGLLNEREIRFEE